MIENNKIIQVYDKYGRRVEDFDDKGKRTLENPPGLFDYNGQSKRYVCVDTGNDATQDIRISDFTLKFGIDNPYAKIAAMQLRDISYVPFEGLKISWQSKKIISTSDNRYFGIWDSSGYIFFDTKKSNGDNEAARNWKRYDNTDQILPEGLKQFIETLKKEESTGEIKINEFTATKISPDKIQIINLTNNTVLHSDSVNGVGNNVCVDPQNPNVIYYTRSQNAGDILRLDTSSEPMHSHATPFKSPYPSIEGLQLDPSGNFFIFNVKPNGFKILEKDTLNEVKTIKEITNARFDKDGRIRGFKNGNLVILEANFAEVGEAIKKKRAADIDLADVFEDEGGQTEEKVEQSTVKFDHVLPIKNKCEAEMLPKDC